MNEPPPAHSAFRHPVPPHFRLESQSHHHGPLDLAAAVALDVNGYGVGLFDTVGSHPPLPQLHPPPPGPATQFLTPGAAAAPPPPPDPLPVVARLQEQNGGDDDVVVGGTDAVGEARPHGTLTTRIVADPPQLEEWRQRLFNVDDMILLSNEEFETYFPHVDNVYSHRSSQKYKRKPFISHYWDCRMKGRPPGTPKSEDPAKKKRKRMARERDLCDVKIKITEYLAGVSLAALDALGVPLPAAVARAPPPGEKFWTIQRVNGNGANGKGDGVTGPHKHSLERSDDIKKNSVQRHFAERGKQHKKTTKVVARRPTGPAAGTARRHAKDSDLKLYAACFCPFSQRVWIALEAKGLPYQYCETDPFKKPTDLLEANPRGLVPAIRSGDWACGESGVILEYLEDLESDFRLFPTEPRLKANCRYWIDHINSRIVPAFYLLLHATDPDSQNDGIERLQRDIKEFIDNADELGPYFLGKELCLVDVHFAPFALRLSSILGPLRKWTTVPSGLRWRQWIEAIESNASVCATTSSRELYEETYEYLLNTRHLHPDVRVA